MQNKTIKIQQVIHTPKLHCRGFWTRVWQCQPQTRSSLILPYQLNITVFI